MKKYIYTIYNVEVDEDFSFMGWEMAGKHGWSFASYRVVWHGSDEARDDYDLLDYLYEVFNTNHPVGFQGHSMSVSDIVRVRDEDNNIMYYYCDSFGWKDVTSECTRSAA